MRPFLNEGDFVFGLKYFLTSPKIGDVVVFDHTLYGLCVKKVTNYDKALKTLNLTGENVTHSLSSEQIGVVKLKSVKCRVVCSFKV